MQDISSVLLRRNIYYIFTLIFHVRSVEGAGKVGQTNIFNYRKERKLPEREVRKRKVRRAGKNCEIWKNNWCRSNKRDKFFRGCEKLLFFLYFKGLRTFWHTALDFASRPKSISSFISVLFGFFSSAAIFGPKQVFLYFVLFCSLRLWCSVLF